MKYPVRSATKTLLANVRRRERAAELASQPAFHTEEEMRAVIDTLAAFMEQS